MMPITSAISSISAAASPSQTSATNGTPLITLLPKLVKNEEKEFVVQEQGVSLCKLSKITIRPLTKEEEFTYLKRTVAALNWFQKHGFKQYVILPQHKSFDNWYRQAEKFNAVDSYEEGMSPHFAEEENYEKSFSELYNPNSYVEGLKEITSNKKESEKIDGALKKLSLLQKNWGFQLLPKYQIRLTLYGVTANDDVNSGTIFLRITPFVNNFSGSIIHEVVHIGVEKNIVQKFKLTCAERECLVDLICSIYFKEIFPKYTLQYLCSKWPIAKSMAEFVNEKTIIADLPQAISQYAKLNPRVCVCSDKPLIM